MFAPDTSQMPRTPGAAFAIAVSVPSDHRFVGLLGDLTVRIAEYAGYGTVDAEQMGHRVRRAAMSLIDASPAGPSHPAVDVSFRAADGRLDVDLRCGREQRHTR